MATCGISEEAAAKIDLLKPRLLIVMVLDPAFRDCPIE